MYLSMAALLFSVIFTILGAGTAAAQLWVCPQQDGSTLFTDQPKKDGSCTTYEPSSKLVYAPPINWANMPPRDPVAEARRAQTVLPDSEIEDTTVGDDTDAYDSPFDNYGDDYIPPYTQFYYGVPFFRQRPHPGFQHKPTRHFKPNTSSGSTSLRPQPSDQRREGASRVGSEAPPRSSPYIVPPIGHSQSIPSTGMREGVRGAAPGSSGQSSSYIVPPIEAPQSSPSTGLREGSGGTAPGSSRESAPYIVPPIGHEGRR